MVTPRCNTIHAKQHDGRRAAARSLTFVPSCALTLALTSFTASAATLTVGPGEAIMTIAEAAQLARDGDTVMIMPGEYRGDVAVWQQKRLSIVGVAPRPILIADGKIADDKAIWVIKDGEFDIDNIEFRGARTEDRNGAGIRFEHGSLVVRNSVFSDNQIGLLTANFEDAHLSITDSVFSQAPEQHDSLPHLLYVGRIGSLEITGSRFHGGHIGHLIKSRARQTTLRYNLIYDGAGGKASYEVDLPNGGDALLVGNIIGQSSETDNPVVIAYGAEGDAWPNSRLRLAHNTLLSDNLIGAWFLRVWKENLPEGTEVTGINNLTVGLGLFTLAAPGEFSGNLPLLPGALAGDILDFSLPADSLLRGWVDPLPEGDPLQPTAEFTLPIGTRPIPQQDEWVPGARQTALY